MPLCCGSSPHSPQRPALFLRKKIHTQSAERQPCARSTSLPVPPAPTACYTRLHLPFGEADEKRHHRSRAQTSSRRSTRALASHRSNTPLADSATRHPGAVAGHGLAAPQLRTPSQPATAQPDQSPRPRKPTRRPPAHGPADRERPSRPPSSPLATSQQSPGPPLGKAACRAPGGAHHPPPKPSAARKHSGNAASPPATSASPKLASRRFSAVNARRTHRSVAARASQSRNRLAPQRHPQPPNQQAVCLSLSAV